MNSANTRAGVTERLPSELDPTGCGKFLVVDKNKLSVRYTGSGAHPNDVGSIQANCPVPRKRRLYYFEMTVKNGGDRGCVAIGFAPPDFKTGRQPGWEPGSYGYHGDDGRKYHSAGHGTDYSEHFSAGDVIGAGLHLESQEIFFTKNGKHLGVAFRHVVAPALVPTIGLHSQNEAVEVNFGAKPFAFDVDAFVKQELQTQDDAITALEVPAGVTHQLVRDYLAHFGYAATLMAFDSAAGIVPGEEAPADSERLPELQLRHATRAAIDAGNIEAAEALIRQSPYAHILDPPAGPDAQADPAGSSMAEAAEEAGRRDSGGQSAAFDAGNDVHLHLSCQKFIELMRTGQVDAAVAFGQQVLAPLLRVSPAHAEVVAGVFALVAYQEPGSSPLAHLLSLAQQEATADVVNTAILAAAAAAAQPQHIGAMEVDAEEAEEAEDGGARWMSSGPPPPPPMEAGIANGGPLAGSRASLTALAQEAQAMGGEASGDADTTMSDANNAPAAAAPRLPPPLPRPAATLQRLLAQLVVVRHEMHEANGGQGEVFRLEEHMLQPEPKAKTA